LSFWLVLFGFGISSAFAQNILIFSTSHSNTGPSQVDSAQGVLKLQISTFSAIEEIRVNDEVQALQGETSAQMDIPYELNPGENRIAVLVKTEKGEQTKSFVLNLIQTAKKPGEKAKKPFQFIVVGTVEQTDNATSVKEDKEADSKTGLTLIPRYKTSLVEDDDLLLQGIVLREKYSNSELSSPQVEFMQLSASWLNKAGFGDWQVDAGYSDVGSTTAADATRADIESGAFIGGSVRLKALDNKNVSLGLKYLLKNTPETDSEAHDGDGGKLAFNASWDKKLNPAKFQLSVGYEQNDAKGMYKDYTVTRLGAKGDYPLSKMLLLSGQLKSKQTAYAETDPLKGEKEATSISTASVKGSYQLPIKGLICAVAVTQKNQSSNITSKEYSTLLIGFSVIYVYQ